MTRRLYPGLRRLLTILVTPGLFATQSNQLLSTTVYQVLYVSSPRALAFRVTETHRNNVKGRVPSLTKCLGTAALERSVSGEKGGIVPCPFTGVDCHLAWGMPKTLFPLKKTYTRVGKTSTRDPVKGKKPRNHVCACMERKKEVTTADVTKCERLLNTGAMCSGIQSLAFTVCLKVFAVKIWG